MILSIDVEKTFDKFNTVMLTIITNIIIERNSLSLIKSTDQKLATDITLNGERKCFPSEIRNEVGCLLFTAVIQHSVRKFQPVQ